MKYKFQVGIVPFRTVTVEASNITEARELAVLELDERAHAAGKEAPAGWDLKWVQK